MIVDRAIKIVSPFVPVADSLDGFAGAFVK